MPKPNENENEKEFISRCIPIVLNDGTAQDEKQAAAICYSKWEDAQKAMKFGARNSSRDQARLQDAHDLLVENGAACGKRKSVDLSEIEPEEQVVFGGPIKAIKMDDGSVKFSGPLVTFSTQDDPDLTGDFFTKGTDFGDAEYCDVWFNHRMPVTAGDKTIEYKQRLGKAKLTRTDAAIFAETILKARNEYEQAIVDAGLAGKLGWSSGTGAHLVDREPVGKAYHIKSWILGPDASLTPCPAEPRNSVIPLKSLSDNIAAIQSPEGEAEAVKAQSEGGAGADKSTKENAMEITPELQTLLTETAKKSAEDAVKAYREAEPPVKTAEANLTVVKDESEQPWKSKSDFFQAVKVAGIRGGSVDPRLLPLKATGLNEAIPSQGGFLVPEDIASGIISGMYSVGSILSLFNPIPVSGNRMVFNVNDETSHADGSRFGGITGYRGYEGGTKTASKPKFRQLDVVLQKYYALCVATDELLEDAPALEGWLSQKVPLELRFMIESDLINGLGGTAPLGFINSPALKSATRTDASEVDAADIGRVWAGRLQGLNDYVWLINPTVAPQLSQMTIGQMPMYWPAGGMSGLPYGTLYGRPVIENEYCPSLGTLGDILLVSPSQVAAITKSSGMQAASSIHVYFTQDETAFRWVYRWGSQPIWNSTLTGYDSNTYSPYVALAAST